MDMGTESGDVVLEVEVFPACEQFLFGLSAELVTVETKDEEICSAYDMKWEGVYVEKTKKEKSVMYDKESCKDVLCCEGGDLGDYVMAGTDDNTMRCIPKSCKKSCDARCSARFKGRKNQERCVEDCLEDCIDANDKDSNGKKVYPERCATPPDLKEKKLAASHVFANRKPLKAGAMKDFASNSVEALYRPGFGSKPFLGADVLGEGRP